MLIKSKLSLCLIFLLSGILVNCAFLGKRPSNDPNSEAFISRGPRNNAWGTPNWNRKFAERAPTPLIQDETVNSEAVTVDENEDYAEPAPKLSNSDGSVNSTVASPTEDPNIAVTARTFINSDGVVEYEAATIYENANFAVPSSTPSDPYGPDNLETATPTLMSVITPPPASYGACTPTQCTLTASSVSIYYWPSVSQNTDCLTTLAGSPGTTLPPNFSPVWPSIYAIVISFTATDGCVQIGNAYHTFTASFAPEEVSIVSWESGEVFTNHFADAPCGPPGHNLNGKPFEPWFAPPTALFDQMGGAQYDGCQIARWRDPSYSLVPDNNTINGPELPSRVKPRLYEGRNVGARGPHQLVDADPTNGPDPPQDGRAAATAHVAPQAPTKTLALP